MNYDNLVRSQEAFLARVRSEEALRKRLLSSSPRPSGYGQDSWSLSGAISVATYYANGRVNRSAYLTCRDALAFRLSGHGGDGPIFLYLKSFQDSVCYLRLLGMMDRIIGAEVKSKVLPSLQQRDRSEHPDFDRFPGAKYTRITIIPSPTYFMAPFLFMQLLLVIRQGRFFPQGTSASRATLTYIKNRLQSAFTGLPCTFDKWYKIMRGWRNLVPSESHASRNWSKDSGYHNNTFLGLRSLLSSGDDERINGSPHTNSLITHYRRELTERGFRSNV